jgi:diguanylate cyclase (GGDEF)-like protein
VTRRLVVEPWLLFAAAGLVGLVAYFRAPATAQAFAYDVFGCAAVGAILLGTRLHRPSASRGWIAIALGIAFEVAGDITYSILEQSGPVGLPSLADVFYLAGLVVLAGGLARIAAGQHGRHLQPAVLDASLVSVAAGVVTWSLVIDGRLDQQANPIGVIVACLYPLLDLVLVGLLARRLMIGSRRTPAVAFLLAGFVVWVAADFSYIWTSVSATYEPGGIVDAGWLLGYVLFGAAALHPSMSEGPMVGERDTVTRPRLILIGASLLVGLGLLAIHPIDDPADVPIGAIGTAAIVGLVILRLVDSLRRAETLGGELERQATTDSLTGLPNRRVLVAAGESTLAAREPVALLFLDLDGFKRVNDTWGHDAGDRLLVDVAAVLKRLTDDRSVLARLGGDEFGVLVRGDHRLHRARDLADTILDALSQDFVVGDMSVRVRASIGIAVGQHGDFTKLAREADVAMYQAKHAGGGRAQIHRAADRHVVAGYRLAHDLDRAAERGQLRLWYQPVIDLETGRMTAAEALVRWQHPTRGLIPPDVFIPLAESTGAIGAIDAWVLRTAVAHVSAWQGDNVWPASCQLHVNVSGIRLGERPFVEGIESALRATGVRPSTLVVELTESANLSAPEIGRLLGSVHRLGVKLALDDFGTQYATLSSIAALPFDIVKLDRSLLPVGGDPVATRLLAGVLRMTEAVGASVIAEGVETDDQLSLLRSLGCRAAQGYLLGRPTPADDFGRGLVSPSRVAYSPMKALAAVG